MTTLLASPCHIFLYFTSACRSASVFRSAEYASVISCEEHPISAEKDIVSSKNPHFLRFVTEERRDQGTALFSSFRFFSTHSKTCSISWRLRVLHLPCSSCNTDMFCSRTRFCLLIPANALHVRILPLIEPITQYILSHPFSYSSGFLRFLVQLKDYSAVLVHHSSFAVQSRAV